MHHVHSKDLMSDKQFGFTPQRSMIDATMELKEYVEKNLKGNEYLVLEP